MTQANETSRGQSKRSVRSEPSCVPSHYPMHFAQCLPSSVQVLGISNAPHEHRAVPGRLSVVSFQMVNAPFPDYCQAVATRTGHRWVEWQARSGGDKGERKTLDPSLPSAHTYWQPDRLRQPDDFLSCKLAECHALTFQGMRHSQSRRSLRRFVFHTMHGFLRRWNFSCRNLF